VVVVEVCGGGGWLEGFLYMVTEKIKMCSVILGNWIEQSNMSSFLQIWSGPRQLLRISMTLGLKIEKP
jgi:hypothetical protein